MPTRTSILIALLITLFPNYSKAQTTGTINGHEYVDLGLSVLWATTNVGADDISDIGKYNMWIYWRDATSESGNDDVSTKAQWEDPWRLPTVDEVKELINKCSWQLEKTTTQNYDIIRITGPNGNYIYLIADVSGKNRECSYWTGSTSYNFGAAYFFTLTITLNGELSQFSSEISSCHFMSGCLTRPVADKSAAATQTTTIPTFTEEEISPPSGTINGYDYVDMGNGVKWGTCNVGADRPSDFGSCFAWGEINTKSGYTQKNSLTRKKKSVGVIASRISQATPHLMPQQHNEVNHGASPRRKRL